MKNTIIYLFLSIFLSSCINRNTGYRIVGQDGKVIYFQKKRPTFNEEKLKEKQLIDNNTNIKNNVNDLNKKKINNSVPVNSDKKIDENLLLDSSAYSLRSVVDTMVKDEDINYLAKTIEKNNRIKTIKDFDIPESYFNSNAKQPIVSNKNSNIQQSGKINLNNYNSNISSNKKHETSKLKSFFARFRKSNDNENIENKNATHKADDGASKDEKQNADNKIKTKEPVFDKNQKFGKNSKPYKVDNSSLSVKSSKNISINANKSVINNTTTISASQNYLIKNKYYIQLGSFEDQNKANKLIEKFTDVGKEQKVVPVIAKGKQMYRAVIGNFNTKAEAEKEMEKVLNRGHFDVYIFKK